MSTPGIQLDGLCFSVGAFTLDSVSLAVPRGEYLVLTGPNGAGKTVMLRLIAGLYQPDRGDVWLDGRRVTGLPPWARGLGVVPQEGLLFPNRTVAANIAFGLEIRKVPARERRQAVEAMAERLGIRQLLDRRPGTLSGGERQKASLARTLVLKPSVLLLDEPISAVDEQSRDTVLCKELRELQRERGITVIHVAHNRDEIDHVADRVAYLQAGRLARLDDRRQA